jgi:hypothetical protein
MRRRYSGIGAAGGFAALAVEIAEARKAEAAKKQKTNRSIFKDWVS